MKPYVIVRRHNVQTSMVDFVIREASNRLNGTEVNGRLPSYVCRETEGQVWERIRQKYGVDWDVYLRKADDEQFWDLEIRPPNSFNSYLELHLKDYVIIVTS